MSCYDCALQYSLLRKQFRDQPIASHQLVQEKLAWMISEITKGQLLVLQVGRLKDANKVGIPYTARSINVAPQSGLQRVDAQIQLGYFGRG